MRFIKLNKKQKSTMVVGLSIILLSLIVWLIYGGEIFTKTQVLVDVKDELFDTTYKEWRNKFIWGLDLTLLISGITVIVSIIIIFIQKRKKE